MSPKHIFVYPPKDAEFSCSFEAYSDSVSNWPGMYFEPDGSFVWVPPSVPNEPNEDLFASSKLPSIPSTPGSETAPVTGKNIERKNIERQQIDGMVYDRNGRIEYLDLKGAASLTNWYKILAPLWCSQVEAKEFDLFDENASGSDAWQTAKQELENSVRIFDVGRQTFLDDLNCLNAG